MENFEQSYAAYNKAVTNEDNQPVFRANAYQYSTDTSNITSRNGMTNYYGNQRGGNGYKTNYSSYDMENIIASCMDAYERESIIRNFIDLMSDFASQGVRIVCADKRQERFGQEWFQYIHGVERSERFLHYLYRCGTTVVKWTDGKVPLKVQKKWKSAVSAEGQNGENGPTQEVIKIEEFEKSKAVMPLRWTFHDPRQVVMVGGMLSTFVGKPIFGLRITTQLRMELNQLTRLSPDKNEYVDYQKMIPDYVWKAVNDNATFYPLDQSKVGAYYYKKDDWELWGKPLIRPILKDLDILNKLKDCDSAALDGAMSAVRLWKLGSIKDGIVPNKAALDKVRNMIANNVAGGITDLVWGDDLTFQESATNLHLWLGSEKYIATLSSIYAGLGVPPGLTGSSGSSSFTNNNVSLKTLIERLKYGRSILVQFLDEQLALVQKAMGFTKKFEVMFDQMVLSDEAAEKALLLQLWDRDIITSEAVRFAFDMDHNEIEEAKLNREHRRRGKSLPPKASQFHNPEKEHDLMKLAVQKGSVTPSQVGLNLPDKKPGEKTFFEGSTPKDAKKQPVGSPLTGRPKNSKDTVQRKQRRVLPRGSSAQYKDLFRFAESAQASVDELINPAYIAMAGKKNIRSLSNEETADLDALKLRIFSNIQPYSEVDEKTVCSMASNNIPLDEEFYQTYSQSVYSITEKYGRALTINEKRNIMCETFAELFSE